MAKLILSHGAKILNEYELDQEVLTIGRKASNDIQIENMAISGQHAKVITIGDDSFLEDLNSTNGTKVNGSPITKHSLQNDDSISVGLYTLKYVNENAAGDEEDDFEKTMIIRPDVNTVHDKKALASMGHVNAGIKQVSQSLDHSVKVEKKAKLKLLNGNNIGQELEIKKALITLGKPGVQVAAIARRATGYVLIHIDNGHGSAYPMLNGVATTSITTPLADNDIIEVAGVRMEFILE